MDIEAYAKYQQAYTQPVPKLLEDILRNQSWQSLLDLGCGDGALLYQLQKQGLLQGKKVWAVDLSATRMELVKSINPSITCLVRSADRVLEVASGSVDVIVSTQVIEHVPDQATMAAEIARILAPHGQAYISTVFKKWYGWYFYRCQGKWVIDPTHLREYSSDQELMSVLEEKGLQVIANKKTQIWRAPLNFLVKRIRKSGDSRKHVFFDLLTSIKIPVPGYYEWELVVKHK